MKKILVILALLIGFNYANAENFKAPEKVKTEFKDSTTSHTYEIQSVQYPVFKSKSGAFYIWKTSKKSGKKYKYYLPKDIQEKMGRKYDK